MIRAWQTSIIATLAVANYFIQPLNGFLVYHRQAVLEGEIWRLFTGPLVHFSAGHLFFNLLIFSISGYLIERRRYPLFGPLCLAVALVEGMYLLVFSPAIAVFGGLSGIAVMALVYLCLCEMRGGNKPVVSCCFAILIATAMKVFLEMLWDRPVFVPTECFILVPSAHVIGGLLAIAAWLLYIWKVPVQSKVR
jgi:rhomboid family GlyGly-CTERM serine protease